MPQTQTDGIDKPPKKAAIVCFGIGLLLAAGLSACGSESSSEQGSLGAVVGIVEENTGIENSSYAQCLLDGLSDAGLDETGALEAIENLYSADAGQSSVAEPAELTLIGCLNEIPSDLRAALIPPDAELMTEASSYGELDELLDACEGGSDDACFELYWAAPNGSEYEEIAYSCAGRCELEVYAGAEFGSNPYWDGLVGTCEEGFDSSCAELYWYSDVASEYEAFGDVCGGRCEDAPFSVATDTETSRTWTGYGISALRGTTAVVDYFLVLGGRWRVRVVCRCLWRRARVALLDGYELWRQPVLGRAVGTMRVGTVWQLR